MSNQNTTSTVNSDGSCCCLLQAVTPPTWNGDEECVLRVLLAVEYGRAEEDRRDADDEEEKDQLIPTLGDTENHVLQMGQPQVCKCNG